MSTKAKLFVQECIVGVGLLGGIFTRMGVDPEVAVFNALISIIEQLNPDSGFGVYFRLLIVVAVLASWLVSYFMGGLLGIFFVIMAWIGGFYYDTSIGMVLIFVSIIGGFIAVEYNSSKENAYYRPY